MQISIVIKTLNEEKRIAATIESALAALSDCDGEVIIADSGSRDRTIEITSSYPVILAQIQPPARASCGIGPQLGFQYSSGTYICLLDGDMILDPDFPSAAMRFLENNPDVAGVTGHVQEMEIDNLEYSRRVQRNAPESRTGTIDRMNGGGLYRRSAIEEVGYISDRNLHGYEEFDLGVRLRHKGWTLHRLDQRFVSHFGHSVNSYRLLIRRWQSKYIFGTGELLRASVGKPYFADLVTELPELRLWAAVYGWWLFSLAILLLAPSITFGIGLVLALFIAIVAAMSVKKRGLPMGLYTVVAWFFHAAALPVGFLQPRVPPTNWIESKRWEPKDEGAH